MPQIQMPAPKLIVVDSDLIYSAGVGRASAGGMPAMYQIPLPKLPLLALPVNSTIQVFTLLGVGS